MCSCRTAAGRNEPLHRGLLRLAGSARYSEGDVRCAACTMNERFPVPLGAPEVEGIIRSVLRRREVWMLHGWHSDGFRTKQGARGRLSGKARGRKGRRERSGGS